MPASTQVAVCPHCQHQPSDASAPLRCFCTRCGLALRQPCPNCELEMATPETAFTACSRCQTSFWSCQDCGRLYHLDRTSCLNGYCPQRGHFWTSRFGTDAWDASQGRYAIPQDGAPNRAPAPAWLGSDIGGANRERRWPALHGSGLLVSVQESGIIELWAERGAPRLGGAGEFSEESVCLSRLDLGEPASGSPVRHGDHLVILGTDSVCQLAMTSNPSLDSRIVLPGCQGALRAVSLPHSLLVVASNGLWEVDVDAGTVLRHTELGVSPSVEPVCNGQGLTLLMTTDQTMVFYPAGGEVEGAFERASLPFEPEWTFYADRFLLLRRNQLAVWHEGAFQLRELPADVLARPVYCPTSERLYLLLSDHTVRSCSTEGERFSFVCDMPGAPTTSPLRVGEHLFYGTGGRYLCRDEEAMLPRLNSPPWGELSYANGRIFGTTKEGVLFAFCL